MGNADHGPIESQYRQKMRGLAKAIDEIINDDLTHRKTGFVLLMFEFGDAPFRRMSYISNAQRKEMIIAMREWLTNAENDAQRHADV